jgi:hypothetical protein
MADMEDDGSDVVLGPILEGFKIEKWTFDLGSRRWSKQKVYS